MGDPRIPHPRRPAGDHVVAGDVEVETELETLLRSLRRAREEPPVGPLTKGHLRALLER